MTNETRQTIEEVGAVLQDAGRALRVSSHVVTRDTVIELLRHVSASVRVLALRLQEDVVDDDAPRIIAPFGPFPKKQGES